MFVHFWGGSEVAGLQVPFACLSLAPGAVDLAGAATAPDFDELARPEDIAGPGQREGRRELAENCRQIAQRHSGPWTEAMWRFVRRWANS